MAQHLSDFILDFAEEYDIPNGEPILIQLQQSIIPAGSEDISGDVTGQGIHTDGHDVAAILCVQRENVVGAENSLYSDLNGEGVLLEPTSLEEGDALFFRDNSLYHYVSDMKPADRHVDLKRTVLLVHYPARMVLTGETNERNTMKRNDSKIQLRFGDA